MRHQPGRKIFERLAACPMVAKHVRSKWRLRRCDLEIRFAYSSRLVSNFFHYLWQAGVVWCLFSQAPSPLVKLINSTLIPPGKFLPL